MDEPLFVNLFEYNEKTMDELTGYNLLKSAKAKKVKSYAIKILIAALVVEICLWMQDLRFFAGVIIGMCYMAVYPMIFIKRRLKKLKEQMMLTVSEIFGGEKAGVMKIEFYDDRVITSTAFSKKK